MNDKKFYDIYANNTGDGVSDEDLVVDSKDKNDDTKYERLEATGEFISGLIVASAVFAGGIEIWPHAVRIVQIENAIERYNTHLIPDSTDTDGDDTKNKDDTNNTKKYIVTLMNCESYGTEYKFHADTIDFIQGIRHGMRLVQTEEDGYPHDVREDEDGPFNGIVSIIKNSEDIKPSTLFDDWICRN